MSGTGALPHASLRTATVLHTILPPLLQSLSVQPACLYIRTWERILQVTLGDRAHGVSDPANAGPKLSPERFHAALSEVNTHRTVLMDVRNVYESDIGFFHVVCSPFSSSKQAISTMSAL